MRSTIHAWKKSADHRTLEACLPSDPDACRFDVRHPGMAFPEDRETFGTLAEAQRFQAITERIFLAGRDDAFAALR